MDILNIIGHISTLIVIATALLALWSWFKGILPAVIRLGVGLSKRDITIFAKSEMSESLKNLLLDSGLFKEKNINLITSEKDFGKAENGTIFLVYWPNWTENFSDIIAKKKDSTALLLYAPRDGGAVSNDALKMLDNNRNTTLVNFRGRLLNDVILSLITTSYEKK